MNLKIIVAPIVVLIIGIGVFSFISSDENVEISEELNFLKCGISDCFDNDERFENFENTESMKMLNVENSENTEC